MSSESLQVFSGGKGLNQSIALSKAGADVWHAGAVGAGDGDFLIEQMKKAGVHTELIEHLDGQTGHAIIQKDPAGQNCILLYGGANQRITKEMVDRVLTQFEADDFLILQNEISAAMVPCTAMATQSFVRESIKCRLWTRRRQAIHLPVILSAAYSSVKTRRRRWNMRQKRQRSPFPAQEQLRRCRTGRK